MLAGLEPGFFLLAAAAVAAAVARTAWRLRVGDGLPLGYPLKALPVVLAMALVWLYPGTDRAYALLVLAGLAVSLAGDMLIIHDRLFKAALVSFLTAHVLYSVAFARQWAEMFGAFRGTFMAPHAVAPVTGLVVGTVFLLALSVYRRLEPGIETGLRRPVAVYVGAIMVMAGLATLRLSAWWEPASAVAALGAWLFVASDTALALDRFAGRFKGRPWRRELTVGPCYYAGQILIACSVALS